MLEVDRLNATLKEIGGSNADWKMEAVTLPEKGGIELRIYHRDEIQYAEMDKLIKPSQMSDRVRETIKKLPYVQAILDHKQKEIDDLKHQVKKLEKYKIHYKMEQFKIHGNCPERNTI